MLFFFSKISLLRQFFVKIFSKISMIEFENFNSKISCFPQNIDPCQGSKWILMTCVEQTIPIPIKLVLIRDEKQEFGRHIFSFLLKPSSHMSYFHEQYCNQKYYKKLENLKTSIGSVSFSKMSNTGYVTFLRAYVDYCNIL